METPMESKRYMTAMRKFMIFKGYDSTRTTYTREELLEITPEDVALYLNKLAFGEGNPSGNARPSKCRANTLAFVKKALSSYMPRRSMTWDPITKIGNPTKSEEVNFIIKRVKKFEVRHQGISSSATRPIEYSELLSVLEVVRFEPDEEKRHMVCCIITLQWHLIARIDDMMKLKFLNLSYNVQHPFAMLSQLRWSKNIIEEREAPEQIILGSLEPLLCPILNLAIYLETQSSTSEFVFGNPEHGARIVCSTLHKVLQDERFQHMKGGKLLTHIFRKGAATYASRAGAVKDHVDHRGRWRKKKSTVDIYIDVNLPYPDALVASTLTGSAGPCMYMLCTNTQYLTNEILPTTFAPKCAAVLAPGLALLMAKALIWASVADHEVEIMPANMKENLKRKVLEITGLPDNPVTRSPVYVCGKGDQMNLMEVGTGDNRDNREANQSNDAAVLTSSVLTIKRRMEEIHNTTQGEIQLLRAEVKQQFARLQSNVSRIAIQPVARRRGESGDEPETNVRRQLLGTPKDLFDLWKEYEFGLCGNKPARSFTSVERGQCKSSFSRRKIFWDVIDNLVRKGYTSDVAIDRTYGVYGQSNSVNTILLAMRKDRKNGGHRDLR